MKKGISIHIGMGYYSKEYYGGEGRLATSQKDSEDMLSIAASQNFESNYLLLNEEATTHTVIELITQASKELQAGDMLFLTYSGHGMQCQDENGDEEIDESWCLFDRPLLDDELHDLWRLFAEGVRIFVISDSCYSGTITRVSPTVQAQPIAKFVPQDKAVAICKEHKGFFTTLKEKLEVHKKEEIKATVKLISGCQDDEQSWILDKAENSLLTAEINRVWNNGEFIGDSLEFFEEVKMGVVREAEKIKKSQTPNYSTIGQESEEFDTQRPFSLYG